MRMASRPQPNKQSGACQSAPATLVKSEAPHQQQQAWLWGDTSLSDTVLKLVLNVDMSEVLLELPVHSAVLGTASEYMRAALLGRQAAAPPKKKAKVTESGPRVITESIEKDQLNVATALMKFIYTGTLDCAAVEDLMQVACLANRWQVTSAVTAALQKLSRAPVLTALDISHIMMDHLPCSLLSHPVFATVQALCQQHLLRLFGNVQDVIRSAVLLEQFCSLSFAAVKLWLSLDELQVDSENSVVVAVSHWWLAQRHPPADSAAKEQLCDLVRLGQLSTSFLFLVLPQLPWWYCRPQRLSTMHMVRAMCGADPNVPTAALKLLPADWCKPPRAKNPDKMQARFEWQVYEAELLALHEKAGSSTHGGAIMTCEGFYWSGYKWHLSVLRRDQKEPLWVGLTCTSALPTAYTMPKLVQASFRLSCMETRTQAYTRSESLSFRLMASSKTNGTKTLLSGPTSGDFVGPEVPGLPDANLLPDGKLCIKVEMESMQ